MGRPSFAGRSFVGGFSRLNRRRPWHRLPLPVALVNLIALRVELRQHNLTDTRTPDPSTRREAVTLDQCPHLAGRYRTADGSYNALDDPDMGMAGSRFGRNVALDRAVPEPMPGLMEPNPHTISRTLMRRDTFTPATSLNLLAAAWIQFQTHDWFAHDRDPESGFEVTFPTGTPGTRTRCGCPTPSGTTRGPTPTRTCRRPTSTGSRSNLIVTPPTDQPLAEGDDSASTTPPKSATASRRPTRWRP